MAGIRKRPLPDGKFQGWYKDAAGRRIFFTGTDSPRETKDMAEDLERHGDKIRIGTELDFCPFCSGQAAIFAKATRAVVPLTDVVAKPCLPEANSPYAYSIG
ncbi:MAG: hypothetical protein NTW87_05640, partial [Planctomycetota bacterium]|nr:hypothetical protein [Planctomycetota bacterium]